MYLSVYFSLDLNGKERYEYLQQKSKEYSMLREKWSSKFKEGNLTEELRFITSMVKKDVIRTDRTHTFFKGSEDNKNITSLFDMLCTYSVNHPDVSYCQGMSDIAAVVLVVQNNEAYAYICFCSLMKRLKANFLFDGKAMTYKFNHLKLLLTYYDPEFWTYLIENEVNDLFFTYRWLLLELKREFPFNDALYMLEVMWSTLPIDTSANGLSLSDIYSVSNDGKTLSPKRQKGSVVIGSNSVSSGTPSTPTPYTKLLSQCRKSSQSNTPVSQETVKQILEHSPLANTIVLPRNAIRLSNIVNEVSSSYHTSAHSLNQLSSRDGDTGDQLLLAGEDQLESCLSTFYLTVTKDENGQFQYINEDVDDCSDAIESSTSSRSNCNGSCSSADSGITTQHDALYITQTVSSELQFAFESSDSHKNPPQRSVFPHPDEFGFGNPFLMFAAFTMILQHRDHIIKNKLDFDSIVMLFDRKVRKNDVHAILRGTKAAYEQYRKQDHQAFDCC